MSIVPRKFYLDDLFNDLSFASESNKMKCDIYEKDGVYNILMDIPGFEKKDINVETKDGYIKITAEKKTEENDENKNYIRRERTFGKYERSFYLGDLDEENIKASFQNGTLNISVPKKEKEETKKIIDID